MNRIYCFVFLMVIPIKNTIVYSNNNNGISGLSMDMHELNIATFGPGLLFY